MPDNLTEIMKDLDSDGSGFIDYTERESPESEAIVCVCWATVCPLEIFGLMDDFIDVFYRKSGPSLYFGAIPLTFFFECIAVTGS